MGQRLSRRPEPEDLFRCSRKSLGAPVCVRSAICSTAQTTMMQTEMQYRATAGRRCSSTSGDSLFMETQTTRRGPPFPPPLGILGTRSRIAVLRRKAELETAAADTGTARLAGKRARSSMKWMLVVLVGGVTPVNTDLVFEKFADCLSAEEQMRRHYADAFEAWDRSAALNFERRRDYSKARDIQAKRLLSNIGTCIPHSGDPLPGTPLQQPNPQPTAPQPSPAPQPTPKT